MDREKNNAINMLIGKEIQIARMRKNITQQQIGDFMGVTRQMVSMWESGARALNLDDFLRMCNHFGFDGFSMIQSVIGQLK